MKVLALGATGAIGGQLITLLSSMGHEVSVTSRSDRSPSGGIRYIRGNAHEEDFIRNLLKGDWDVVVDFMVYNTEGFKRRVDALLGSCQQYLFTSTARVFADSSEPLTERSPRLLDASADADYLATDEYALTKARQEDMLRASGKTNWTISRPYITFGEGRLQLGTLEKEAWLYRALHGRSIVFCRDMTSKWTTLTDGSDVAGMMASLVGNPAAYGEDFNLTSGQAVTWDSVLSLYLEEIEKHLGHRPKVLLQSVAEFCRGAPTVAQIKYDRLYDRRFDPRKINAVYGAQPTDPLPAIRLRLLSQLKSGQFLPLQYRGEAMRDRAAGERTPLGAFPGARSKLGYLVYRYSPHVFLDQ